MACRRLGKKGGLVYTNAPYGQNTRLGVVVHQLWCAFGDEASLNDCQTIRTLTDMGYGDSAHTADVGVACKELGEWGAAGACCLAAVRDKDARCPRCKDWTTWHAC